jgi:hypothetical protein
MLVSERLDQAYGIDLLVSKSNASFPSPLLLDSHDDDRDHT